MRAVAEWVTATTAAAPNVSVLATSREALGIAGEHLAPLASLGVPATVDVTSVVTSEAGALFVALCPRRREGSPCSMTTQPAVLDICAVWTGSHWR